LIFGCGCSRFGEEKAVVGKKKAIFCFSFKFLAVFVAGLEKKRRWLKEIKLIFGCGCSRFGEEKAVFLF